MCLWGDLKFVPSVFKMKYSSSSMSKKGAFTVVPWKGRAGLQDQYPTMYGQVNFILEEMRKHVNSPLSEEIWRHRLLDNMDDDSVLALFVVETHPNKKELEVVGFVNADTGSKNKVYIKHLIATVKRRGVGTLLLQTVVDIVEKMGKHTFAYVTYKPTETLSLFYNKCGFVDPTGLELPEMRSMKSKLCETYSQLGVKMLSCLGKQPLQEEEAEASTKRQRVLVAADKSV
jgi:GNAT superfamily N-acetyltransferase